MIKKEQIILNKNNEFINASKVHPFINNYFFIGILKVLSMIGLSSAIVMLLSFSSTINLYPIDYFLKFLIFIGLIAFALLRFIQSYFRRLADSRVLKDEDGGMYDIFKTCDFELANILGSENLNNPDILKIFESIITSKRAFFILREMNVGLPFNEKIVRGFPLEIPAHDILIEVVRLSLENAIQDGAQQLTAGDIFYGFLKISRNLNPALMAIEIDEKDLQNIIFWENNIFSKLYRKKTLTQSLASAGAGIAQNWAAGYTLDLDRFGTEITMPKLFGSFSIEGRDREIRQMENVLSKEMKNNCIITGGNGVGKTTLVYGLAERIYWGNTLSELSYKRLVSLDTSILLAGSSNEREVEERLIRVFNDAVNAGNIILFIDNIEVLFSGGQKIGSIDASEIIIPYLQNPNLRIIGVTTHGNYQTYIEAKPSLAGNFEKIEVEPTNEKQTLRILEDLSMYYSNKYNLVVTYNALKEIYRLSEKFITNKDFPAKAVDMLDNVCSAAKNTGNKLLDKSTIDSLAEQVLNVSVKEVDTDEKKKLINLEVCIHGRVIGQDEAVVAVCNALRRARAQVSNTNRPIGSFLFLGPTGVGKTELAKSLADAYFGNEKAMVRMDMNEYQDTESTSRFIGKKMIGIDQLEGGDFVKKIRENPFSVVLLDELEKAHPDVLNLFLQLLDEGYIIDGMGEKVIFSNTIIIATSNAGANLIKEGIEKGMSLNLLSEKLLKYLQSNDIYKPEFLNRFDGIIVFKPLTRENLFEIAKLMFNKIKLDFKNKGYDIEAGEDILSRLAELGYRPELGARPMRRVFQDTLENFLANKILDGSLNKGEKFIINIQDLGIKAEVRES